MDHLAEVGWAVFMMNLIIALIALLFRRHLGTAGSLIVYGVLASTITLFFGGLVVLNLLFVRLQDRWSRRSAPGRDVPAPTRGPVPRGDAETHNQPRTP